MWTWRRLPRGFWQSLALVALPSAILVGIEIYHATAIVPEVAHSHAAVAHTLQVIDTARALDQSIQDAERGQRGFIITGDAKYLEPYTQALTRTPAGLAQLKDLTKDDPAQQKRLSLLEQQINVKFAELKQTIAVRQDQGFEAARQIVETDLGQDTMHAITDLIGFAISDEYKLLTARETRAAEDQRASARAGIIARVLASTALAVGVFVLILNLTRVATAHRISAASEERFRLLIDGAKDYAIYMLDPDGNVVSWNIGAERIKGYTDEEIIGRNFACFFTAEDVRAGLPDQHLRTAAMEGRFEHEGWRVRKDGSRFWANAVLTALCEPDGSLRGFVKITRDISERRHQQEALAQSQAALGAGTEDGGGGPAYRRHCARLQQSVDGDPGQPGTGRASRRGHQSRGLGTAARPGAERCRTRSGAYPPAARVFATTDAGAAGHRHQRACRQHVRAAAPHPW